MKQATQISFIFLLFLTATILRAQPWIQVQQLVASERAKHDAFGMAVDISDNYAICGSYLEDEDAAGMLTQRDAGAAYIFEKDKAEKWTEMQKLVASDRKPGDHFGVAVAISGEYAMVGAPDAKNETLYGGKVYVFKRNPVGLWVQHQIILLDEQQWDDHFGLVIDMDGDLAAISAFTYQSYENGQNSGAVYVYEVASGNWVHKQKLIPPTSGKPPLLFGGAVALSGNNIMIKAFWRSESGPAIGEQVPQGIVFAYRKNSNGVWEHSQEIQAPEYVSNATFGLSVSISDTDAIITGASEYVGDQTYSSVFIYKIDSSEHWNQVGKIVHVLLSAQEYYGYSAAISTGRVLIGAPVSKQDLDVNQSAPGSVFVYLKDGVGNWNEVQQIQAVPTDSSDFFGCRVAIYGRQTIIGAASSSLRKPGLPAQPNAGAAYIFRCD
jgi:hypothetical protein